MAISLYFAILRVSPSPFCVLDEIEAALDDVNVSRFASYLRRMSGNTQFIAITHRRGTMEEADVLYGGDHAGGGRVQAPRAAGVRAAGEVAFVLNICIRLPKAAFVHEKAGRKETNVWDSFRKSPRV